MIALTGLLLSVADVNDIMGVSLTPHQPVSQMGDHRNLLPNLNCLGVWQVNEAPVYDASHWKSVRQQMLRTPDTDQWETLVVQSVVSYRTAVAARDFFTQSADRWSKCTNHHVNIQLNNQQLPAWLSGELTRTDTQLAIPIVRGNGDQMRSCQRVLTTRRQPDHRRTSVQTAPARRPHAGRRHRRQDRVFSAALVVSGHWLSAHWIKTLLARIAGSTGSSTDDCFVIRLGAELEPPAGDFRGDHPYIERPHRRNPRPQRRCLGV